jgi:hypothetical protein
MPENRSAALPDEKKSRAQLLQELAELRTRMAAAEKPADRWRAGIDRRPPTEEVLRLVQAPPERTADELGAGLGAIAEGVVLRPGGADPPHEPYRRASPGLHGRGV